MKTKVLLAIIAVLFVAVLYLLFLNFQKPTITTTKIQQPTVSPTPAVDLTVDWKTYTDNNWNYSVKYPSDWKVISFEKPIINIMPANSDDPRLGSVSLSLTMNQEKPVVPSSFTNFSNVDPSTCGNSTWAVKNNQNDSFACWKYNRDVRFTAEYSPEVTKDIYQQIVSSFRFFNITTLDETPFVVSESNPKFNLSGENVYQGSLSAISLRFNKALDVSTIKNNNIGVLWGINDYVPSEINYDNSTYTVTLLFKEPIQSGRSTVVVKNVKSELDEIINPVTFSIDIALD